MPTIKTQLASQLANEQVRCRQALLLQLRAILFLTRQGIALCGHTESEGNLTQLMQMWAIHNDILQLYLFIHCDRFTVIHYCHETCVLY